MDLSTSMGMFCSVSKVLLDAFKKKITIFPPHISPRSFRLIIHQWRHERDKQPSKFTAIKAPSASQLLPLQFWCFLTVRTNFKRWRNGNNSPLLLRHHLRDKRRWHISGGLLFVAAAIRGTARRGFLGKDHLPPPEARAGHQWCAGFLVGRFRAQIPKGFEGEKRNCFTAFCQRWGKKHAHTSIYPCTFMPKLLRERGWSN